jgi:anti-sigma factor RsiW
VKTNIECERARRTLMASLDGEGDPPTGPDREHLTTCAECRRWQAEMQSVIARIQQLSYPAVAADLWTAVEPRIGEPAQQRRLPRWLVPAGVVVLAWRVLQLFVDFPIPVLHPIGQLAAVVVALWLIAGHLLAIETSAPELQKRGV